MSINYNQNAKREQTFILLVTG